MASSADPRPSTPPGSITLQDPHGDSFLLHYGDMTDSTNLIRLIQEIRPTEIYNLAAQSHVQVSSRRRNTPPMPTPSARCACWKRSASSGWSGTRFYQASTSELFGKVQEVPQNETTPFYPRSPYAAAKLYAYWITVNYREAYGMHASNGILFNHEGPTRGETFVTRKITRAVAAIELGLQEKLHLGNLDAKRDWGHARDYVEGMWLICSSRSPTITCWRPAKPTRCANSWSAFKHVDRTIEWSGKGVEENGKDRRRGQDLVRIDPAYFRPTEVELLLGDPRKARDKLGWHYRMPFAELVSEMVAADMRFASLEKESGNVALQEVLGDIVFGSGFRD